MDFKHWNIFYKKIIKDFNFSHKEDKNSADILDKILENKKIFPLSRLENMIQDQEIVVFGAGPSLEKSLKKNKKFFKDKIKISADGATTVLVKNNIFPEIIVTDLDGKITDQLEANKEGSIAVIHAHGDNIENIKKIVSKFDGYLIGTTQTDPEKYNNLYNFGGFTDGDRAIFLSDHFKAKKIFLVGFDFDGEIGEYSFTKNFEIKKKKLKWCKYFIEYLMGKNRDIQFL